MPVRAEDGIFPVITAQDIRQLASIFQIDFEDTTMTGNFAMNAHATRLITFGPRSVSLWQYDDNEHAFAETRYATTATPILAAFTPDQSVYVVLQGNQTRMMRLEDATMSAFRTLRDWTILSLWADDEALWAEAISNDLEAREAVLQMPYDTDENIVILPYAPANDLEAVVRLGRISPPYAVTSTETGRVTVWHLPSGTPSAQAETGIGEAAVFGALNASGTHLAWRDAASEGLYWLDLKRNENVLVDDLAGDYVQWFFLTARADVILGIDKAFTPHVTAWIVGGEMLDLGPYRTCGRPQPDMALLSSDGTTLVIGCDTGLEIWRIPD